MRKFFKIMALSAIGLSIALTVSGYLAYQHLKSSLPKLISVKDYRPLLVTQVFDRNNRKVGEFFRERRIILPIEKIPQKVIQAFLAAEDDSFYEHHGVNYLAIFRALIANIRAGQTVQGASTITQQVAKTLLLKDRERTFSRKFREFLLAREMEKHLKKEDILFLYLNQIYFGQGAYGIELAAQTIFRKPVNKLTLAEIAVLAGLPKAPSAYSPVTNPKRAKERQLYVLSRMASVGYISEEEAAKAGAEPLRVFVRENYDEKAPFYMETLRQLLVQKFGEELVLDKGIMVYTAMDLDKQLAAQEAIVKGLK
ncbi:MAG: transglycosylase domain-containing protein, partial [Bdellovibrionaceae bacterium]|nr:transglycosylase domain-containing protein [Pseudobdellovibrionaceae bacterium]